MESETLRLATQQGIWAVLFVVLLFYILKKQEQRDKKADEREAKYQETIKDNQSIISKLATKLNIVETIKDDIEDIKNQIFK